jgi:hypothetical protein
MRALKPTLAGIRREMNQFQEELLEEVWQYFRTTGEWPILRILYSKYGKHKVRNALSSLKGNVGWEESGPKGWMVYHFTLLAALLTQKGPDFYSLLEKYFNFQRNLFKNEPETAYVTGTRIAQELKLSQEDNETLGQLLYLGQAGGSQKRSESWAVNALVEAEGFPEKIKLSAQVNEWIFRNYRSEMVVFQDERTPQHSAGRQLDFPSLANSKEDEFGTSFSSAPKISYLPNTAFIMMWMDKSRPELDDVSNALKEVCDQFGIKAIRADEVQHEEKITDVILKQIRESQFLIADLTGERPNVYYEVGYAHSLGKYPILFCKNATSLHFDLAGYNVPGYENITKLKDLLKKRLEAHLGKKPKTQKLHASQSRKRPV